MLNIDFSNVKETTFSTFGVGTYKVFVNGIEKKKTMDGSKQFLEVRLTDGTSRISDKVFITEQSLWRVQQFLKACQLPHKGKVSLEEKQIVGRHLVIKTKAEAYKKQDGTDGTAIRVERYEADPEIVYGEEKKEEAKQTTASEDAPF